MMQGVTQMHSTTDGGQPPGSGAVSGELLDRETRVRRIGAEVRSGSYHPPLDGVVESLVMALLPHFRARG